MSSRRMLTNKTKTGNGVGKTNNFFSSSEKKESKGETGNPPPPRLPYIKTN